MKILITFILSVIYIQAFSQKNIDLELEDAEKFANRIIENNLDKISHYYKLISQFEFWFRNDDAMIALF